MNGGISKWSAVRKTISLRKMNEIFGEGTKIPQNSEAAEVYKRKDRLERADTA